MTGNDAKPKPTEFSLRRVAPVLLVVFGLAFLYLNRGVVTDHLPPFVMHWMGKKTVDDRLAEYGPAARARLQPFFAKAAVAYPPARVEMLAVKDTDRLEVYAANEGDNLVPVTVYEIQAASGYAGPKLAEGDSQVPEGIYPIESINPNSQFHLSLRVGYPNAFDIEHANRDRRSSLGGDIMIHGAQVSAGCLAMGDQVAEDLFVLAADTGPSHLQVIITPVDFRKTATMPANGRYPSWSGELYKTIRSQMAVLPTANPPLAVQVDPSAGPATIQRRRVQKSLHR